MGASLEVFKERYKELNEIYNLFLIIYRTGGNNTPYRERSEMCAQLRKLEQLISTYDAIIYYKTNKDIQKDSLQAFIYKLQRNKMTSDLLNFYFSVWLYEMKDT